MRARYGPITYGDALSPPRHGSFIWKDIIRRAPFVMDHVRWSLGSGDSVDVWRDAWISCRPLSRWPSFVSIDMPQTLRVTDLIQEGGGGWRVDLVSTFFGPPLACRILSIPIPTASHHDIRVWDRSCCHRAPPGALSALFRTPASAPFPAPWIWKVAAHPRVHLFLWKVAWGRLPTRVVLRQRGVEVPAFCPVCGLVDETVAHSILECSRARVIWRSAGFLFPDHSDGRQLEIFLDSLRHPDPGRRTAMAYIAYQIWLSRNSLVFEDSLIPVHRILRQALSLAAEFGSVMSALSPLDPLIPWISPAAVSAGRQATLVSWEAPPQGFVKVNFDGSVRGAIGGAGYVIRDPAGRLLAAGGRPLVEPSVPEAELTAAWMGVLHAVRVLQVDRIILEGDSFTIISWLQDCPTHCRTYPCFSIPGIFCVPWRQYPRVTSSERPTRR